MFLSGLAAMVALVIAMISTLPKTCDPHTEWYQGSVMYEIFPASFFDSNKDMLGDFKGMSLKADHMKSLGVRAVRLNSIFATQHYPEDYKNVSTLIKIAPQLGSLNDFTILTKILHKRNISLLLDLPVFPVLKQLVPNKVSDISNNTKLEPSVEFLKTSPEMDLVEEALIYWKNNGVDGFYLKGLEYFVDDPNLAQSLRRWKKIVGSECPVIISEMVINTVPRGILNTVLDNVDLIDVRLEIEKGVSAVSKQIESIQNGTLFSRPGLPWIQWSLGDESSNRLANILPHSNATLGATLLQLMLPGTPSIFYGNEIGLQQNSNPEFDRNLRQLVHMSWPNESRNVLYWMPSEETSMNLAQVHLIKEMANLRSRSPAIYINSVYKQGDNKVNAEVKYSRRDLLVIQRWYPRRKSYVVVSNLGNSTVTADLSTLLYSGVIVIGPRPDSKSESISFKDISLWPGESVVIQLD
ncbi:Alpha-amylase domain containing protein [Asbolus verrucosus]|uniref:Alpha-amylase domain containing protein n=1 Tax=Asbolus verrucosus TaxID=1661398 RepID=A0A482WDD7_ASBVE|nr:Alpha-amylase domain containing protein [Asbolus verrucosus]